MLLHIPGLFSREEVLRIRQALEETEWADGKITAGHQSAKAKDNAQLPEDSPAARAVGALILDALSRNSTFFSAALPKRIYPPLFNRYDGGQSFDYHVDNAVRYDRSRGGVDPVRTDLSATLFLSAPEDYDKVARVVFNRLEQGMPLQQGVGLGDRVRRRHPTTLPRSRPGNRGT